MHYMEHMQSLTSFRENKYGLCVAGVKVWILIVRRYHEFYALHRTTSTSSRNLFSFRDPCIFPSKYLTGLSRLFIKICFPKLAGYLTSEVGIVWLSRDSVYCYQISDSVIIQRRVVEIMTSKLLLGITSLSHIPDSFDNEIHIWLNDIETGVISICTKRRSFNYIEDNLMTRL